MYNMSGAIPQVYSGAEVDVIPQVYSGAEVLGVSASDLIRVPRIEMYGVGDLERKEPLVFEGGYIGTDIVDEGKAPSILHATSGTLKDMSILYQCFLSRELGQDVPELPGEVWDVIYYLFNDKTEPYANVTNDFVFTHGLGEREGMRFPRLATWCQTPGDIYLDIHDEWATKGSDEVIYRPLPPPGYTRRTNSGIFHSDSGAPRATARTREAAKLTWTDAGYPGDFADLAVSRFDCGLNGLSDDIGIDWRALFSKRKTGRGCVAHGYINDDGGRFSIKIDIEPEKVHSGIGSFPRQVLE
jgi:hypothetical protein